MAKFCGGVKYDDTLKMINGILCDPDVESVDESKAVTSCGQKWDGELFKRILVKGVPIITLHETDDSESEPILLHGNCGVGLDGRFFHINKGIVSLRDGFLLTVNTVPTECVISVFDANGEVVAPYKDNKYLLSDIDDNYTVTVSKEGYKTKTQTIRNNGDQAITIELIAE